MSEVAFREAGSGRPSRLRALVVTGLVVCVPLALGGVLPASRALFVGAMAALVAAEWLPRALRGRGPDGWERAWLVVWAVVSAAIGIQLLPLPSAVLDSVGAHPAAYSALADVPLVRLSPTPQKTAHLWATFSAYWALAFAVARFRRREVAHLLAALGALAAFEAFYGLYSLVHGSESILGVWEKRHYLADATGTFVNRNHFAGLLALCWPLGIARLLLPLGQGRSRLPAALRWGLVIQLSLLVGTALFASHSRLGLVSAFGGLAVALALAHRAQVPELRVPRWAWVAVPVAALVGAVWIGSGPLVDRVLRITEHTDRLVVWSSLPSLPARTWILGAGAGAFGDVFKSIQPAELGRSYRYAHSDWLELFVDFGIVGVAAIVAAGWVWWRRVRAARWGPLHAAAAGGLVAIAIHCAADFDLHVPGVAVVFWAVVGVFVNRRLAGYDDTHEPVPAEAPGVATA